MTANRETNVRVDIINKMSSGIKELGIPHELTEGEGSRNYFQKIMSENF